MPQRETDPDGQPGAVEVTGTDTPMTAELREHLGRRLRSEFRLEAEQPAFLGDTAVPPQFTSLVRRIEEREELPGREGLQAIRDEFGLPDEEPPA